MARRAKQNLLLTLWLLAPIAVVGLLITFIYLSFAKGPLMHEPGVGAGAGDAGGANAIGQMIEDEQKRNTDAAPDEQSED